MSEEAPVGDRSSRTKFKQIAAALHELCQPLTTLQCSLEMAALTGTLEAYREAMETGLAECRRLVASVESMREILQEAKQENGSEELEEAG